MKNNQSYFTEKLSKNPYIYAVITDKEKKQTPEYLSEDELRKLSDKELDEHNSKIIKELVKSFMEEKDYY